MNEHLSLVQLYNHRNICLCDVIINMKQNILGAKKWRGQEKQQRLKGVISECGQGFYNSNTSLNEILSPISNIHRL